MLAVEFPYFDPFTVGVHDDCIQKVVKAPANLAGIPAKRNAKRIPLPSVSA